MTFNIKHIIVFDNIAHLGGTLSQKQDVLENLLAENEVALESYQKFCDLFERGLTAEQSSQLIEALEGDFKEIEKIFKELQNLLKDAVIEQLH